MEEKKIVITITDDDYTITSDFGAGDMMLWLEIVKSHLLSDLLKSGKNNEPV